MSPLTTAQVVRCTGGTCSARPRVEGQQIRDGTCSGAEGIGWTVELLLVLAGACAAAVRWVGGVFACDCVSLLLCPLPVLSLCGGH